MNNRLILGLLIFGLFYLQIKEVPCIPKTTKMTPSVIKDNRVTLPKETVSIRTVEIRKRRNYIHPGKPVLRGRKSNVP